MVVCNRWTAYSPLPLSDRTGQFTLAADDRSFYALDGKTGAKKWSFKAEGSIRLLPGPRG